MKVVDISHHLLDSESLIGDRCSATLEVVSGAVPTWPSDVTRVVLAFDHRLFPLKEGETVVLRFMPDGRLFDLE